MEVYLRNGGSFWTSLADCGGGGLAFSTGLWTAIEGSNFSESVARGFASAFD
jgi:hypothetical protein